MTQLKGALSRSLKKVVAYLFLYIELNYKYDIQYEVLKK